MPHAAVPCGLLYFIDAPLPISMIAGELFFPIASLEELLQLGQKRGRIRAVEGPVVETLSDHPHHARRDEYAFRRRHHCGLQLDGVGRKNWHLRRIDNRRRERRSEG